MSSIYDVAIRLLIERCLCSKLTTKELGGVYPMIRKMANRSQDELTSGGTAESTGNVGHIWTDSLDPITLALDLGGQEGHATDTIGKGDRAKGTYGDLPVAVKLVVDITTNVNNTSGSHIG